MLLQLKHIFQSK